MRLVDNYLQAITEKQKKKKTHLLSKLFNSKKSMYGRKKPGKPAKSYLTLFQRDK